jgi:hypothetical protein
MEIYDIGGKIISEWLLKTQDVCECLRKTSGFVGIVWIEDRTFTVMTINYEGGSA